MKYIKIKNLSFKHNQSQIINNINLDISEGSIISLIGPSNSFKHSLIKVLSGLEDPLFGEIYTDEKFFYDYQNKFSIESYHRRIGLIDSPVSLWEHLNVEEHLKFVPTHLNWSKSEIQRRINYILEECELTNCKNKTINSLTSFEKFKLLFARAVTLKIDLLLIKEPYFINSPLFIEQVNNFISVKSKKFAKITMISTDFWDSISSISTKQAICSDKAIEQFDRPENLLKKPINIFCNRFYSKYPTNFIEVKGNTINLDDLILNNPLLNLLYTPLSSKLLILKNSKLILAIKADNIELSNKPSPNYFKAKIHNIIDQNIVEIKLEKSGSNLSLFSYTNNSQIYNIDDIIYFKIGDKINYIYDFLNEKLVNYGIIL